MNRRSFLRAMAAAPLAASGAGVAFAQANAANYRNLLVLIELKGGNDGLNTVVPYADPTYYELRPRLAVARDQVLQLDEAAGLNPALKALLPLWQSRELAIVQGVGYPGANLSHFRSIEIWDTASKADEYLAEGWLSRAFARAPVPREFAADGVVVGGQDMGPLAGVGTRVIALADTQRFLQQARLAAPMDDRGNAALRHIMRVERDIVQAAAGLNADHAFRTEFPRTGFGNAVRTAAQIVASRAGVAVVRLSLNGFDTHSNQTPTHARLLQTLAEGVAALKQALVELGRWESTLVMTYAEFGRRPRQNMSGGTDHGTSSVHFLAGGKVRGGLYGAPPALTRLDGNGNLPFAIDFREVYATVLERWWGVDSAAPLKGRFRPLDVLWT
jgi:uncharacterized protein (DUF1501 family)